MRLCCSVLTIFLLHSARFVSARWETGLDGELYGEIPRPTSEPLLYRDEFRYGAILMETRLGSQRNGTTRRDATLGARQNTCDPGYVLSCPARKLPCCQGGFTLCCGDNSNVCCSVGYFCVGINSCCKIGQVGCSTGLEGCCPAGTKCCGMWCCPQGYECRSQQCINVALSSHSVASVKSVASVRSKSIRSKASVASVQGRPYTTPTDSSTSTPTATTSDDGIRKDSGIGNGTGNANSTDNGLNNSVGNGNNNALVGGVVGGVLGVAVLGLVGFLLWRRKRGRPASPTAGQPLFGQQLSSQPTSPAFSTNTSYPGGPPVTYAAQAGWDPRYSTVSQGAGPPPAGQASAASLPHAVNTWIDRPPTIFLDNSGGHASQSQVSPSPAEGPVDPRVPRDLYSDALRGSTYSAMNPPNIPSSSAAAGTPPPPTPAPAYPFAPPAPERAGPRKL